MFVWWYRGQGYWAGVIPLVAVVLARLGLGFIAGEEWTKAHKEFLGVALCLAGIAIWFLGRKLNGACKARHTVYFFHMEYAALFWATVGVALFFGLQS